MEIKPESQQNVFESTTSVLEELENVLNSFDPANLSFDEVAIKKEPEVDTNAKPEEIKQSPRTISCDYCVFKTNSEHILTLHRNFKHDEHNHETKNSNIKSLKERNTRTVTGFKREIKLI